MFHKIFWNPSSNEWANSKRASNDLCFFDINNNNGAEDWTFDLSRASASGNLISVLNNS